MVAHFRHLSAHKRSVLELYRTLLKHAAHIRDERVGRDEIMTAIKAQFREQKSQMSLKVVQKSLKKAFELEENLRLLLLGKDVSIEQIKKLSTIPQKVKPMTLKNKFGQPIKRDLSNEQELETQQIQNYVNNYIRMKRRADELPKVIDPLILEHIIKPEALHHRAQLHISKAQEKLSTGPYRVHISQSAGVKFLRGPWRQSSKVSPMILHHVRKEQQLIDYLHYFEENKWLYNSENTWERLMGGASDWGVSIQEDLTKMSKEVEDRKREFRRYGRNQLPKAQTELQVKSNKIHLRMKERLDLLLEESKGITAFEEMLNKPTLRHLVHKYSFDK
jgi:hypothetical protein